MKRLKAIVGYTAAVATVLLAVLVPFVLIGRFSQVFASLGLHVDEMYSGGPRVRSIPRAGYTIDVHRQVDPHLLQSETSFVQLDWRPVATLPARVDEVVDIDGDNQPDVHVTFDAPRDPKAKLKAAIVALNPKYVSMRNLGVERRSALIVRVDDAILVRVPLAAE
ncbi:MAG TPA: hypothetical protein VD837_11500 [Terriglobales bacterium]|nr:hypothetical protein [Terriglobales bacterium]